MESNSKIPNTFGNIDGLFSNIPKSVGIVIETPSVSEKIFLRWRDSGFKPEDRIHGTGRTAGMNWPKGADPRIH